MGGDPFANVRAARARLDQAREQWVQAVVDAHADRRGATIDELAKAAGVSRPRIYQLLAEHAASVDKRIETRRADEEFRARLEKNIAANRDALDRLAE